MNVQELLESIPGQHVMTARAVDRVEEVARVLERSNIGAVPVCDSSGKLEGMLSERDIVHAVATHGAEALGMTVGDLMTRDVIVCSPQDTLPQIMERMSSHRIRHLPVVEDGSMRGIVSERDVMRGALMQIRTRMNILHEGVSDAVR